MCGAPGVEGAQAAARLGHVAAVEVLGQELLHG